MFIGFVETLRRYGVPAGTDGLLLLHKGLGQGLAVNLDEFCLLARLCFVKRAEHYDPFERAFLWYCCGVDLPAVGEGDDALLETKQFREWLRQAMAKRELPYHDLFSMSREELMRRFWETVRAQQAAHHGGNRWVGTGGFSPYGHGGAAQPGVRVQGESSNRSAVATFGDRRYVDYSAAQSLSGENLRQALELLKLMERKGAQEELAIDASIDRSAKLGDIELVFRKPLKDTLNIVLCIDNGGSSMLPWANLTRLLFSKFATRFTRLTTYYFHNAIYGTLYRDAPRTKQMPTSELLERDRDTRLLIIGDACMAPEELLMPSVYLYGDGPDHLRSGQAWLKVLRDHFPKSIWLNPIPKETWEQVHGSYTISAVRDVMPMEDLTLGGLRRAVARLSG